MEVGSNYLLSSTNPLNRASVYGDAVLINTFIALQIAGVVIFLSILLTAIFSSRVVRHPTWFSF